MSRPVISVALIAYDMPRQAANTIRSLTLPYQRGVDESFFEVVVVENRSTRTVELPDDVAPNVRYHLRDKPGVSPAAAINFGLERARGDFICLMIDGARMVTPGILQYAAMARRITDDALVVVPGYHLGSREQHLGDAGEDPEAAERALLAGIRWPEDGYRLFEIACGAQPTASACSTRSWRATACSPRAATGSASAAPTSGSSSPGVVR